MLGSKTRGNLDPEATRLLAQGLNVMRTAFVEVIDDATSAAKDGA